MSAENLKLPGTAWRESDRLKAIEEYKILDTPLEDEFQDMVKLAAAMCNAPIALVSIVAKDRQWFKAEVGLDVRETPLAESICKYTIQQRGLLVIPDIAQDPRFLDHPFVIGKKPVRFYAGVTLETPEGLPLGAMCILDSKPRQLTEKESFTLTALARQVMIQLEQHHFLKVRAKGEQMLRASELSYRRLFEAAQDGILILDLETGRIEDANPFLVNLLGFSRSEMVGKTVGEMSPFKDVVSNQAMLDLLQKEGYVRYENLPLETKDGRQIAVEFVSNVYQVGEKKVIQCNIRDVTERKKLEKQLLWKTAFFEAQVNSAIDGIIVVDSDFKTVLQNQQMIDLWRPPEQIAHEADHRRRLEWITTQVKDSRHFEESVASIYAHPAEVIRDEVELKDGRFLDRYTAPVIGKNGQNYGRIWAYRDITERKVVEKKLLEKTALSEAQIHSALDAIIIVDREGNLLIQNKQLTTLWNPPKDIIEEVAHHRRLDWVMRQVKNPKQFVEKVEHLYAHPNETSRDELDLIDGRIFDRYTAPVLGLDGTYFGRIWAYRDITERKRSEARFRLLVDSNVQGVLFWNRKGEITGANDAFLRMVRYTREDLEAGIINWMGLTPPEYTHLDLRALEEITAHGVCQPYEKEYILQDGSRVPILLGSAAFKDTPDEGVAFVLDLTERKKLEQQFLRAQRMESIGTLAGGIAHDLNNILAPIMMSIELLKSISENSQAKEILETIEVSAKRGADIVRQVLSFARGMEGERTEVQPKHLLEDIETIIKDTFPKNIHRKFSLPNDIWKILGDPTQLHQILLNLCVNARDAMPDGGKLTIAVENVVLDQQYAAMHIAANAGKHVCISVTDSGSGIPPAILDKIFEPFFTTKEVGKGTGLGLSTVLAIVKSHGGFINAYSEPGKGTTFKVYLPATKLTSEERRDTAVPPSPPRGNGETILMVDDEASILTITSKTLEAFGYRILTAADGTEALALYAQHRDKIAVVLTDMAMPIMDGAATIRALRKMNPAIKIIAASGLKSNASATKVSLEGIKYFLTKPYTAGTLLNTVRAILDEV